MAPHIALRRLPYVLLISILLFSSPSFASSQSTIRQSKWSPTGPLADQSPVCPRAVARGADSTAWMQPPYCIQPKGKKSPKYCAYSSFRGFTGVGLVTTPAVAETLIDVLRDPDTAWEDDVYFAALARTAPYEVKEIPGKGLGVVATRVIYSDEIIMTDRPVFVVNERPPEFVTKEESRALAQAAFEQLPERERKAILEAARSTGGDVIEDVMRTNAFGLPLNGVDHTALFPLIARINHACRPNAAPLVRRGALAMEVLATKKILAGEEISISYTALNLYHADRRAALANWGFECKCELCASPAAIAESDSNRKRIEELYQQLDEGQNHDFGSVTTLGQEMMRLVDEESFSSQAGHFCEVIADAYWRIGQLQSARVFGECALKKHRQIDGPDSEVAKRAEEFLREVARYIKA